MATSEKPTSRTTLLRHSFWFAAAGAINKSAGLLLLPVYTGWLSTEEYGLLALALVLRTLIENVAHLGMGGAVIREILHEKSDPCRTLGTALIFLGLETTLLCTVLVSSAPAISSWILGDASAAPLITLAAMSAIPGVVVALALARLRAEHRARDFALGSIFQFASSAVFGVVAVVVLERGAMGVLEAGLSANILLAGLLWPLIRGGGKPAWDSHLLRRMLRFSLPLVGTMLVAHVMTSSDRFFLANFATMAEVGLYAVGYQLGMAMNLPVQAVQWAWPACLFSLASERGAQEKLAGLVRDYTVAMAGMAVAVCLFAEELLWALTPASYHAASAIVPGVVAACFLNGWRHMSNSALAVRNRTYLALPCGLVAAGLNLVLNAWWIPQHGWRGAIAATVISYGVWTALQFAANQRVWRIPYPWKSILWTVGTGISLVLLAQTMPDVAWPWRLAGKVGLLTLFPLLTVPRSLTWLARRLHAWTDREQKPAPSPAWKSP